MAELMKRSSALALAVVLLVGLSVLPAAAQDQTDDGYPLDTDGEVLDRDVTVDDAADVEDVAVVEDVADTEGTAVLGRVLARTGGSLALLLIAGALLIGAGWYGLAASRRRRPSAGHG